MSANLRAFLYLIRYCEGTAGEDGYRMHYGGELFDSFADHPRRAITRGRLTSTAAGAYQFLSKTWDECAKALNLPDFSPASQDNAAIYLIKRRGALADVEAGRIEQAIQKCNREWASLPGSPYGQPTKSLAECLAVYHRAGGSFIEQPATEVAMPLPVLPFIAAALPALIEAAPDLIRIVGDGKQSNKNAKVAEKIAEIAKTVTAQPTVEQATAAIQADPAMREAFRQGVQDRWYELVEVGPGIAGAQKFALDMTSSGPAWRQIGFGVMLATLALGIVLGGGYVMSEVLTEAGTDQAMKAQILDYFKAMGFIVAGYVFGSSSSSRAKDEMLAKK